MHKFDLISFQGLLRYCDRDGIAAHEHPSFNALGMDTSTPMRYIQPNIKPGRRSEEQE